MIHRVDLRVRATSETLESLCPTRKSQSGPTESEARQKEAKRTKGVKMRTLASILGRLPLESETLPGVFADSARLCRPGKSACVAASYQKLKKDR